MASTSDYRIYVSMNAAVPMQVFKHHHEEATGRTSSISQHTLCLDASGAVLNDTLFR
jgi:hypothetical protein